MKAYTLVVLFFHSDAAPDLSSNTTVEFESSLWISESRSRGSENKTTGGEASMDVDYENSEERSAGMSYEEQNDAPKCVSMIVIGAGARGKVSGHQLPNKQSTLPIRR